MADNPQDNSQREHPRSPGTDPSVPTSRDFRKAESVAGEPAAPRERHAEGAPFGGAPVEPRPPSGAPPRRRGWLTCLVLSVAMLGLFGIVAMFALSILSQFLGSVKMPTVRRGSTVGLVRVEGMIADYNVDRILEVIDEYAARPGVRAVLVRIQSGGGTVGGSQEIYEAIKRLRKSGKKVVATVMDIGASGAYYLACGADEIYANPGSLTGSIGVLMSVPNLEELGERFGVTQTVVKSGRFKDVPSIMDELTPEERAYLQSVIDDTHGQFVEAILSQRREAIQAALDVFDAEYPGIAATLEEKSREAHTFLRFIADGRVMTGRQARAMGLVDALGTQNDAFNRVAELAGIDEPEIYEYQPPQTFFELLTQSASSTLKQSAFSRLREIRLEYRLAF